ncbi:OsmC family protein [Flexivirga sp. B27]
MAENHSYPVALSWQGSTGEGYDAYSREHRVGPAGLAGMKLSADPHFGGDPAVANPEHLLVMAASSCQLLSFLAVAARARLDVVDYADAAEGTMPQGNSPMSVTTITLRPVVTLATGSRLDQLERLTRIAHEQCFIANSLRSLISIDARFVIDGEDVARVNL